MKQVLRSGAMAALLAASVMACDKADENVSLTNDEVQNAFAEAEVSTSFEELDAMIDQEVANAEHEEDTRRVQIAEAYWSKCAQVVRDSQTHTVTITFDGECTDDQGNVRSGTITISRNGRIWQSGGSNVTTLDGYTVNGIVIEGKRTVTNITENVETDPFKFSKVLENGKITWVNGDVATRNVNHEMVWNRGVNNTRDSYHVSGSASGVNRQGVSYTNTISTDLVYQQACLMTGNNLPVSGVLGVQIPDKPLINLEFGAGECDRMVTVSVEGRSRTFELN